MLLGWGTCKTIKGLPVNSSERSIPAMPNILQPLDPMTRRPDTRKAKINSSIT